MKGYILITGTSTGIGQAVALELAKNGYTVFAGIRKLQDGEVLKEKSQNKIIPIIMDVSQPNQIAEAFQTIQSQVGTEGLKALINNAGINYVSPMEFYEENESRNLFEVNFWGVLSVTKFFLPLLRVHASKYKKSAKVINVGSIGSVSSLPFIGMYNAAKFALYGMSEALRFELNPHDIKVVAILPGGVKTDIWQKTNDSIDTSISALSDQGKSYYAPYIKKALSLASNFEKSAVTSEKAAKTFLKVVESKNPGLKYLIGMDARFINFMVKYFPNSWRHAILRSQFKF
jgi:short-subunit dehydrogenase